MLIILNPQLEGGMGTKAPSGREPFNYRPVFGELSIEPRTIEVSGNGQPAELKHILQV